MWVITWISCSSASAYRYGRFLLLVGAPVTVDEAESLMPLKNHCILFRHHLEEYFVKCFLISTHFRSFILYTCKEFWHLSHEQSPICPPFPIFHRRRVDSLQEENNELAKASESGRCVMLLYYKLLESALINLNLEGRASIYNLHPAYRSLSNNIWISIRKALIQQY
jgi:hypothetical protein